MRSIKEQLALWHIVVILGTAAIAIPIAARVGTRAAPVVSEGQQSQAQQPLTDDKNRNAGHVKYVRPAVSRNARRFQDDYYERRREHWENRLENRLEYRDEYLDEQTGDNADAEDSKDSKAGDDDGDAVDQEHDIYEQRREYWRNRVEKEW